MTINPTVQPGEAGHAAHHRALAAKVNTHDDLVTTGRLSVPELEGTYVRF